LVAPVVAPVVVPVVAPVPEVVDDGVPVAVPVAGDGVVAAVTLPMGEMDMASPRGTIR
jgi:hypothetical protein